MNDSNPIKQHRSLSTVLFAFFLFACLLCVLWFPYNDGDVWWHIAVGNEIVENHSIPAVDAWTYTAYGQPYIYHSWLSELILAIVWSKAGTNGLELLKYAVHLVTCFYFYRLCRTRLNGGFSILLTFVLAYWLSYRIVRPYIVTPLFTIVLFDWLFCRSRETVKRLFCVLLLFLFWVNLHGGFAIGLFLLAANAVVAFVGFYFKKVTVAQLKWRVFLFPCVTLVTFLNPYGARLYISILGGVKNQSFDWLNIHLFPLPNVSLITTLVLAASLLFMAWLVVRCVSLRKFEDWRRLIIVLTCFYLALSARRLEWLLLFPSFFLLVYAKDWLSNKERWKWVVSQHGIVVSILLAAALCAYTTTHKAKFSASEKDMLPESFADYIAEQSLEGNVFCPLQWSGRISLVSDGKLKTFIDGRLQLHPANFFTEYLSYMTEKGLTPGQIEQYQIDYLLIPSSAYDFFVQAAAPIMWKPLKVYDHAMLLKRAS